ncbi:hypothetical protein CH063_10283 [Colletotrichum higginsianum]|uniref:Uncharacterized protein n=1 Tax=Colletotrichum higginsianum (strain IMI 349063) TaxID=759273 RepID=H1VGV1_COLHI|nr:hypothetical protein CH063_10283 [Colletotrichum higginsianum]
MYGTRPLCPLHRLGSIDNKECMPAANDVHQAGWYVAAFVCINTHWPLLKAHVQRKASVTAHHTWGVMVGHGG